jgi:signal transduction histidine kinase
MYVERPNLPWMWAAGLVALAVTATASMLLATRISPPNPGVTRALEIEVGIISLICGLLLNTQVRRGRIWPGALPVAAALLLMAAAAFGFAGARLADPDATRPSYIGVILLVIMTPIIASIRRDLAAHVQPKPERREFWIDVFLIAASVTAIFYVLVRPDGLPPMGSITVAIYSAIAATLLVGFGALLLWFPSRFHLLQFVLAAALAEGTIALGWMWTHQPTSVSPEPAIGLPFLLAPIGLAFLHLGVRHTVGSGRQDARRWARPLLTSVTVVAACAALGTVAMLGTTHGIRPIEAAFIIGVVGGGVAARIMANQLLATQRGRDVAEALEERGTALAEAAEALDRTNEAIETLRRSEEHLRLVFEAAVDGIVELGADGTILRSNAAFAVMLGTPGVALEGRPWREVIAAAPVESQGAYPLVDLPEAGEAEIAKPGQPPQYLESRISEIPGDLPRRLMLVRDVTAAKVANQTVRSLFQYLQDRDEDRTRLLRRSNGAIEAERNRIARDLHDGPVQGISAATLSLEAALLMIRSGEIVRGIDLLGSVREELTHEAEALRQLMSGLRPPVLEERGLVAALRDFTARFGSEHHIDADFSGGVGADLPDDLETLVYRVVQEALSNVAKHAAATQVLVEVHGDDDRLRVEIEDDGLGFDTTQIRDFLHEGRVGLASMRERVELAGGTFTLRSTPGRGTVISALLPLGAGVSPSMDSARATI